MNRVSELTRHTGWNMLGIGIPLVAAIFAIPPLIHGLGAERFGVLTIGWVIMGYFALFDLGMGQATTRFVAGDIAAGEAGRLPTTVWSSFSAHIVLGLIGAGAFVLMVPWLSGDTFKIEAALRQEVSRGFYVLAASVPLVVGATCMRGVLEGTRRFDLVNKVKIPAGIVNYLGPLIVLQFTTHLQYVVGVIVLGRGIVLAAYFLLCLRVLPQLGSRFEIKAGIIKPLIRFGGWVAISNLTLPLIASLDRFVIGAVVSMSAVAYYATPYEVVTKLWILSASLLSAMFPVFSALSVNKAQELRPLGARALKYLLVMTVPAVATLLVFSGPLLTLWIGPEFALHGTPVARWLALGVLMSVLAQVPFSMLQGWGRADVPAKLQLLQLPVYVVTAYYLAQIAGIAGVAITWAARTGIELVLFMIAANALLPRGKTAGRLNLRAALITGALLAMFWILGTAPMETMASKLGIFCVLFIVLLAAEWYLVLDRSDRKAFAGVLGRIRTTG